MRIKSNIIQRELRGRRLEKKKHCFQMIEKIMMKSQKMRQKYVFHQSKSDFMKYDMLLKINVWIYFGVCLNGNELQIKENETNRNWRYCAVYMCLYMPKGHFRKWFFNQSFIRWNIKKNINCVDRFRSLTKQMLSAINVFCNKYWHLRMYFWNIGFDCFSSFFFSLPSHSAYSFRFINLILANR